MAIVSERVRSKGQGQAQARPRPEGRRRRSGPSRPTIREVCLVGLGSGGADQGPEGAWACGGRVTWSGRAYRVEATQVRATGTDGPTPMRYVHLAALAEG
jgi:hypothetical protein